MRGKNDFNVELSPDFKFEFEGERGRVFMIITIRNIDYNIDGIIFDKDGTLLDTQFFWPELLEARMKGLALKGIEELVLKSCRRTLGQLPDGGIDPDGPLALGSRAEEVIVTATVLYQNGYHWDKARLMVEEIYNRVEKELDIDRISRAFPGVKRLLEDLKGAGLKLAVATTDTTERAEKMLDSAGLLEQIDIVVGRDMVEQGKPKPEMIELISRKLNIPYEKLVMVGDTLSDMEMAEAAGCIGIGVLTGSGRLDVLKGIAAEVVSDVTNLRGLLRQSAL
ncbi:N-acetylmuramic acid 6-phosphate phosphatase [Koleobacter methoxysyntrophicus]|uniref:N-acetylmuramic acid 6-phosphate phosphatase n=1 Tax=Koleobacter methoxysyntrophicus TaxID=2751313 RepID=A0A8A0RIW4_9FIRM|nr:HAD family hydrolase [Koleobacter methoxysyntrophicus]QSQ08391.1 N-acetylmuramic acid 6-phosphate phosphatase [Koleobacter methoxysyntrophicus]